MTKSLEGRWQLKILNGDPDADGNQFVLANGEIVDPETEEPSGTYHVSENHLVLMIGMPAAGGEDQWSVRARLPLDGALAGEHMLGEADAIFGGGDPVPLAKCAFYRLPNDLESPGRVCL